MRMTVLLACLLTLAACEKAAQPEAAVDPDTNAAAREGARHHELQNAIDEQKKYEDRAKAAGDSALDADKAHDKQLEDSGG